MKYDVHIDPPKKAPKSTTISDGPSIQTRKPRKKGNGHTEDDAPDYPDPVDLWGNRFGPPALPRGLLPDLIERFALDQGEDIGADPAGIVMGALAVCAAATPDKVRLQVKQHNAGWLEPTRLWVALIGMPSTKKTPIMSAVLWPLERLDMDMVKKSAARQAEYDALSKADKKTTPVPKHPRLILQDTTIEAAQEVLKDSPEGVLCSHDELGSFFGSIEKYSSVRGATRDRSFWLQAYNGGFAKVNRIGRGESGIPNLSVSLLGGIQPDRIREIANDGADDGLLQRVLPIVLRPSTVGKDEPRSDVVSDYRDLINRLHQLQAAHLVFDEGAQQYRQQREQWHHDLGLSVETTNKKLAAHLGKYDGLFARLCVLWHCVENAHHGGSLPLIVSEKMARRVGAFMKDFLLPQAVAFYVGELGGLGPYEKFTAVAGYILTHKLTTLTNRDIQRGDRTMRKLDKGAIEEIFSGLDALGWISCEQSKRSPFLTQGVVNPLVHSKFAERAKAEAERRERNRQTVLELIQKLPKRED